MTSFLEFTSIESAWMDLTMWHRCQASFPLDTW